jgi:hypothetical protein
MQRAGNACKACNQQTNVNTATAERAMALSVALGRVCGRCADASADDGTGEAGGRSAKARRSGDGSGGRHVGLGCETSGPLAQAIFLGALAARSALTNLLLALHGQS